MFQSRRSLLIWKILGRRADGWTNDDFPTETEPGNSRTLALKGQPIPDIQANRNRADLDYNGKTMPPPEAVAGTYLGSDGNKIKVPALSDEDKLTLIRWIDLGCPIDLDRAHESGVRNQESGVGWQGHGWLLDDQRPTLALTLPRAGSNPPLARVLVGMHDYGGLDVESFRVVASFAVDNAPAGQNLASRFRSSSPGVWELRISEPITIHRGTLTVSIKDRQGNLTRMERTFSAGSD
jgi:hypothetical protein